MVEVIVTIYRPCSVGYYKVMVLGIKARLIPDNVIVEINADRIKGRDILSKLGLDPESAVVIADGRPIPEDDYVTSGSEVVVVRVLSGG